MIRVSQKTYLVLNDESSENAVSKAEFSPRADPCPSFFFIFFVGNKGAWASMSPLYMRLRNPDWFGYLLDGKSIKGF